MSAALDIGRLTTRIRCGEPERAQALAGQMRQLAHRQLAHALDGATARALARAGLPADAMVAVQRVDLALKVSTDIAPQQLTEGWAAAFEAALASLLARTPAGEEGDAAVWFADAWAAERRHLERRAAGLPDAWWAPELAADGGPVEASAAPAALDPLAILQRWLDRDPPRAVALLAALARADARIATLLDATAAQTLTRRLVAQFARRNAPREPADNTPQALPPTAAGQLDHALDRCAELRTALLAALLADRPNPGAQDAARAAPWLLAALFTGNPTLTRLAAADIERALALWLRRSPPPPERTPVGPRATPSARAETAPDLPASTPDSLFADHEIRAGGLLLLLRPLVRLALLPEPEQLAPRLGDLALTALRRVLAPLPAAERAVAQERERPLLAVFAPECDWRERIATLPVGDAPAADALLDALVDAIPADIAFAPGAERRVFGSARPAFATAPAQRLARLLLRPGALHASAWDAELVWPLASIDLALRRAGWDQDPGWVPWLGRSIRFRFGDAP